jgi:hypothetical protein
MDSVTVLFGQASFEEVEREAAKYGYSEGSVSNGSEQLYFWRSEEREAEHEAEEIHLLRRALGTEVASSFQVASRHGANARFAIQVVHALMSAFKPSVLDDDFGNFWLPDQVASCAESNPEKGIYALRPDA